MQLFDSPVFTYKQNKLYCENVPLSKIKEEVGSPTYVYSKKYFTEKFRFFTKAFAEVNHTIYYACKSNFNLSVIKNFVDLGSGVDVNSEGELYRALKAGADPQKIILTGVGKTKDEIKLGIEKNLLMIKAESEEEVYLINETASQLNKIAKVAIRVNPDVNPMTHPYISTGLSESKFGVDKKTALSLFSRHKDFPNIQFTGIDMHIGSQITGIAPFVEAVEKLSEVFFEAKSFGLKLDHFDVGGGIGVLYRDENPFPIKAYAEALIPKLKKLECEIIFEPGRYLTANGGILLTEVLYTKPTEVKNFIIVDAAMNDLLRPSIYGAYHHIQPETLPENTENFTADIVGPVCESGDFLAKNRAFVRTKPGDLLAIMSTGAYGMAMASNYNTRRRPAEVLVNGSDYKVIRSREDYDHLFYDEEKLLLNE